MKCDRPCCAETILTPEGNEVYLIEMKRAYETVPTMEFMDELLEMGYTLIPWEDLGDIAIGEVADRFEIYGDPMCPDIMSPGLRPSPETPEELAAVLDPWLIGPGPSLEAGEGNSAPN